jgi:hypothetical protein
MRAIEILQEKLAKSLGFLHSKRLDALWRLVDGLLRGQQLWLTELGRSLPGSCSVKHRIKAADRFVGNAAMQMAIPKVYRALAAFLLLGTARPMVLVDWTAAESGFHVLSAKIAFAGRALSILSRTYPERKKANPDVERRFLEELKEIIPRRCRPVIVTDAGFLFKWVDSVRELGWDYVGRIRLKKMGLFIGGRWMRLAEAYKLAQQKARNLGEVLVGKNNPRSHRVVLSAKPKTKGRRRLGRKGKPLNGGVARACRAAAREPLMLITSLPDAPRAIVDIYRLRMQIEETFRDLKSHRYGWSTRHIRTADRRRVDLLLLIGALAAVAMHLLGISIRGGRIARGLQANTERNRNVFSSFFLGRLVLEQNLEAALSTRSLRNALTQLLSAIPSAERFAA